MLCIKAFRWLSQIMTKSRISWKSMPKWIPKVIPKSVWVTQDQCFFVCSIHLFVAWWIICFLCRVALAKKMFYPIPGGRKIKQGATDSAEKSNRGARTPLGLRFPGSFLYNFRWCFHPSCRRCYYKTSQVAVVVFVLSGVMFRSWLLAPLVGALYVVVAWWAMVPTRDLAL